MKTILYLVLFVFLFSCKSNEETLIFKLKNNELQYSVNPDSLSFYKREYDTIANDKDLSTNIVRMEIINTTKNKYLFFVNDLDLYENSCININIYEDGKIIEQMNPFIQRATIPKDFVALDNYVSYEFIKKKKKWNILKKIGFKEVDDNPYHNYFEQSKVVYPNEKTLLLYTLTIPYLEEDNLSGLYSPKFYGFKNGKKYEFSITYELKKNIENKLPQEIIDNLKENNIKIFYGKVESNKIPIINVFK
ncbi:MULTISPECIES: hypothetical protein [Flavobacterium]|nr:MULTISPECIES: hypothetical protein [Flavobacterium]